MKVRATNRGRGDLDYRIRRILDSGIGNRINSIHRFCRASFHEKSSLSWWVVRQITPSNPAHSVRGPKYVVKKGKTPVWSREDAKTLLESIPKDSVSGLRDLALIAAMFYSFARVSAVLKLKVDDITMAHVGG